jgi:hypothetical protein
MATSSIFTTIRVTDKQSTELMVDAMDAAKKARSNGKPTAAPAKELKGESLRNFLEGKRQ